MTTTDHKRIGIMYMVLTFVFFCLGGIEALMIRLQLGAPNNTLVTPEIYNQLFTMHGTTMIFLFVVPMMAGLANYFLPLMIGARDMAYPRLNALSFWLLLAGGHRLLRVDLLEPAGSRLDELPAAVERALTRRRGGQDAWIYLIHLTGLSSILGAINFYATIANMRARGMSWGRLPLFVWAMLTYSVLIIFAMPVIAAAVTMLLTDRHFGTHFFDPTEGGSPLLWQNLFWFFGHPEVYIMVLPGFGIVSEILPVFARKPIFGYKAIAASTVAIAFLGFLTWAHHMFTTPIPEAILVFVMLSSFLIAIPTGVKMLNWIAHAVARHDRIQDAAAVLRGLHRAVPDRRHLRRLPGDLPGRLAAQRNLLRRRAHPLRAVGGAVFPIFAAIYYWFPKITGRMLSEGLGKLSFWLMFFGVLVTFLIQHVIGLDGMPRRVYEYDNVGHLALYNLISTVGSFILAAGVLVDDPQRLAQPQSRRDRRPGPVEGEHARVVHGLAAAGQQLRRGAARALGRTDEGHPPRGRAAQRRRCGAGAATVPAGATQVGSVVSLAPATWRCARDRAAEPRPRARTCPRARSSCSATTLELTKPKVQSLLLLTTIATMYVAGDPSPRWSR